MPLPVRRRQQARRDLIDIWRYIADHDEAAADSFFDQIENVLLILSENPRAGRARSEVSEGLRSFPVGKHVLFYRVTSDCILLTRVISGYRDIDWIDLE